MRIGMYETLILLERLGYECVDVIKLRKTFFPEEEPEDKQTDKPEWAKEKVYKTAAEAKKFLAKGETTVRDDKLGGYVNVPA